VNELLEQSEQAVEEVQVRQFAEQLAQPSAVELVPLAVWIVINGYVPEGQLLRQ
jgi:hypothetical protein